MYSLINKQLFRTTVYSITGKGLRISRQSVFGFSSHFISYDQLFGETSIGKVYNRDLLHTSVVVLIFGIVRLLYAETFADTWFISIMIAFAVCLGIVIFFPGKTVKEPELKITKYFPEHMDIRLEIFLKNLFETRDEFIRYRGIDIREGTNLEEQYSELLSLFIAGMIDEDEFRKRKWLLKSPLVPGSRNEDFHLN